MEPTNLASKYRSIFTPTHRKERINNFESYWAFTQSHSGKIFEEDKDLSKKRDALTHFRGHPVRSRKPLPDPSLFYRNYVRMKDDATKFDRKTLLLTCIYKFARHEWVGISAAWDYLPSLDQSKKLTDKISRYHLCEEFCHVRFFHEMFLTFRLADVEWVPLGKWMNRVYKMFPYFPEAFMAPPAFVTELMGITFYRHVDQLLNSVFEDEPEARDRVRELLYEIMIDELAHIGQRRNFMGPLGTRMARWMVRPLFRMFFKDIPEIKYLFDTDKMIREARDFDYRGVPQTLLEKTWIPTYCQTKTTQQSKAA